LGIRTGAEYLESLRDGREVWLRGERVDPTTHPSLAGCAQAFAEVYDAQHDPARHDLLTMPSPASGAPVSVGWLLPRTHDDLVRKRLMMEHLMRQTGGLLGRLPAHAAAIVVGLYDARDTLAAEDPAFVEHVEAYLEHCQEHDLALSLGFVDPLRGRTQAPGTRDVFRIVEERPDGIVVRGVKGVATAAPYTNDLLVLTLPGRDLPPDEVVYFSCALGSPGIKIVCREPLAGRYPADHPASARFDEMDTWVVFENVFVPRERVFFQRRYEALNDLQRIALAWAYHYAVVRMAIKAEVMAGLARAVAEHNGTADQPQVQTGIADAIGYAEVLHALAHEAERNAVRTPTGLLLPNPAQVNVGRIYAIEREPHVLHQLLEIAGAGILMAPGQADLASPVVRPFIERYLLAGDDGALERFRLLQLAWDYAADSFATRQLLFDMFNARELHTNKLALARAYDASAMTALARRLAGADAPARVP
jgi:4-hydroxyphenylacetate 3-monooxygenase